jgi:hypothetical protein
MHQTKYFELSMFFDYLCIFSPSLAWIIRSLLYVYTQQEQGKEKRKILVSRVGGRVTQVNERDKKNEKTRRKLIHYN